jgi:hypothetical protein
MLARPSAAHRSMQGWCVPLGSPVIDGPDQCGALRASTIASNKLLARSAGPSRGARRVLSQHGGAARATQKEIRTKSLRFQDSKCGKQAKTGGRSWIGNNLRHQRTPARTSPRILFMICSPSRLERTEHRATALGFAPPARRVVTSRYSAASYRMAPWRR